MNLQSWIKIVAGAVKRTPAAVGLFRQTRHRDLFSRRSIMMSLPSRFPHLAVSLGLAMTGALASVAPAQTNYYATNGTEYAEIGSLPGDQVFPDTAISTSGGFVVWQDNITDGDSWGISARRLDSTLSGTLGTFRVNQRGTGSQENPRVAMLKSGGAVFVWQGGKPGYQHVYARFLTPTNTFSTTDDVLVNTFTNNFQINPAVAVLNNSNVVVVWGSLNQAGTNSMQDVYGQILSPSGQKIGGEFLLNQFTSYNQRAVTVAALPGGGFVAGWISEQQRVLAASAGTNTAYVSSASAMNPSVDVYARLFNSDGSAAGSEFLVNVGLNPCASPSVAVAADGSFLFTWTAQDMTNFDNSLDVYGRVFSSSGTGGSVFLINTHVYGDQYMSHVSSLGQDYLVVWTSLGQDGSREGVYGRFVHNDGSFSGDEFRVNTTTVGQQLQPAVAADGVGEFLVTWASFSGYPNTFDLYAQRYLNTTVALQPMSAPYVWAPFVVSNGVYQPLLVVSWAPVQGLPVTSYEVYVDDATNALGVVTTNLWTMTAANGLTTNSTHSFKVDYLVSDGRRSPISPSASGKTWGGRNWNGIPYEWMASYFGPYTNIWWSASAPVAAGGPTLYNVFLSGGSPFDSATWLQTQLFNTSQGMFLSWNTQAGATYQVQVTTNFTSWSNLGSPRFAAETTDSIYVGGGSAGYYRVLLLR